MNREGSYVSCIFKAGKVFVAFYETAENLHHICFGLIFSSTEPLKSLILTKKKHLGSFLHNCNAAET